MPRLDSFIAQLVTTEADCLLLESGNHLWLAKGDRRLPLMNVRQGLLMNEHLVVLLTEIATPEASFAVKTGTPTEFDYVLGKRAFRVEFAVVGGKYFARISPTKLKPKVEEPAITILPAPKPPEPPPPEPPPPEPLSIGGPEIEHYFRAMVRMGASDLHLTSQRAPHVRVDGDVAPLPGYKDLPAAALEKMLVEIMPPRNEEEYKNTKDTDFAYELPDSRLRINVFKDRTGVGAVVRAIPKKLKTAEELGLPDVLIEMCKLEKGLVLVTGPTGSGKSTTLAAMIDWINRNHNEHLITIEDPIEFVHEPKKCLVNQREVGDHTQGFSRALRAALREDPDTILVGEMRDLETIATAVEMAETGHLVFGTLHTTSAAGTVDRIIDQFPADRQDQVRQMVAESLKGVVAQTLCKKVGGGRVAAYEVLVGNTAISNLIRERKTHQIASMLQTSRNIGMRTMNDSLVELVQQGKVTVEEATARSSDRAGLQAQLRGARLVAA